jgi:hypothetical protein
MHFHNFGKCMSCGDLRRFETPIPNILILSSMCEQCGWNDLVGWEAGQLCLPCRDMWRADVEREKRLHANAPTIHNI